MEIIFVGSGTRKANRITRGDVHDLSIEYILTTTEAEHFLISRDGDRYQVTAGTITKKGESDGGSKAENVEGIPRPRGEEPAGSRSEGKRGRSRKN